MFFIHNRSAFTDSGLKCDYVTNVKTKTSEANDVRRVSSCQKEVKQYGGSCRPGIDDLAKRNAREDKKVGGKQRIIVIETCVWSRQLFRLETTDRRAHLFVISRERRGREKTRRGAKQAGEETGARVKGNFHSRPSLLAGLLRLSPRSLRPCGCSEI